MISFLNEESEENLTLAIVSYYIYVAKYIYLARSKY